MENLVRNYHIILLFILLVQSTLLAQNIQKKQNFSRIKLYEAIELIGEKFETSFSYNPQIIPNTEIDKLSFEGKTLEKLLHEVLDPLGIDYSIEGKTVAIYYLADEKREIKVAGKVIDKLTRKPIPGVNVYISKTLNGESTNLNGEFEFLVRANQNLELVATHVSYQPFIQSIASIKDLTNIDIELNENVKKLNELVITSPSTKDWNYYLRIFKREFLGTSRHANKCEIVNPEVINFSFDNDSGLLKAFSNELLVVRNESLGYEVGHLLVLFEFQHGKVRYISKPRFDYMATDNRKQEQRWEKNRKDVYAGSFDHFIQSLIDDRLKDEGFTVSIVNSLGDDRINRPIKRDDIIMDLDTAKLLDFERYLVVQFRELEDRDYQAYRLSIDRELRGPRMSFERQQPQYQTSVLELTSGLAIIKDSYLLNPMCLIQHGYWGWKRNSDLLPYNYKP